MRLLWIAAIVVLIDQWSKLLVVQSMHLGQSISLIGDWLKLTFTENPGMAFGITFGRPGTVTILSILATILVIWYLIRVRNGYWPYVASLALILGGAIGNIIDRVFYGVIFEYGVLFQGRVVDFIHVDIGFVGFPDFIPFIGGSYLSLFPIWNVADMAIVGGVIGVLIFQGAFHRRMHGKERQGLKAAERTEETGIPQTAATLGAKKLDNPEIPSELAEPRSPDVLPGLEESARERTGKYMPDDQSTNGQSEGAAPPDETERQNRWGAD